MQNIFGRIRSPQGTMLSADPWEQVWNNPLQAKASTGCLMEEQLFCFPRGTMSLLISNIKCQTCNMNHVTHFASCCLSFSSFLCFRVRCWLWPLTPSRNFVAKRPPLPCVTAQVKQEHPLELIDCGRQGHTGRSTPSLVESPSSRLWLRTNNPAGSNAPKTWLWGAGANLISSPLLGSMYFAKLQHLVLSNL